MPVAIGMLVTGCSGSDVQLPPFSMQLTLDTSAAGGCASSSCADFGMICGGTLHMRVIDAETGFEYFSICKRVNGTPLTLCDLDVGAIVAFELPPTMVRIEVAIWRPENLGAVGTNPGTCPSEDIFDLQGRPLITFDPQPAFGGAVFFDIRSDDEEVVIPLACTDPEQLSAPDCTPSNVSVAATVSDLDTLLDITNDQATNLAVGIGEPRGVSDGMGGNVIVIDGADTFDLPLTSPGGVPTFAAILETQFGSIVCSVVRDLTPQSVTSVICQLVDPGINLLTLRGSLIPKQVLDEILAAAAIDTFPEAGLVVGRVVDETGFTPVASVRVEATDILPGDAQIEYLSDDRQILIGSDTSSNGYFIARGVPFGTSWTATHTLDGREQNGPFVAGLIKNKVTVLIIKLDSEVIGQ